MPRGLISEEITASQIQRKQRLKGVRPILVDEFLMHKAAVSCLSYAVEETSRNTLDVQEYRYANYALVEPNLLSNYAISAMSQISP